MSATFEIEDTIVAIGSSTAPAARGAVRMTGPHCAQYLESFGMSLASRTTAHAIDGGLDLGQPLGEVPIRVLIWPTVRSYTGQPSLEIHTLGSLPILSAVVDHAIRWGARAARPGEFTLRAFLAGRLDLTQAEAVLGVIDAQHDAALENALSQLSGNLSRPLATLRSELLDLLADVEAGLDFVDEDIQFISDDVLRDRLQTIMEKLKNAVDQLVTRKREQAESTVALRGFPNAGKSQLMNAITGVETAVVADVAGTTRDVVIASVPIGDHRVVLVDTAGIESDSETPNSAEGQISDQAQRHATLAGQNADIRLWCLDASQPDTQESLAALLDTSRDDSNAIDVWVATKCDLVESPSITPDRHWIATSSLTGQGINELKATIAQKLDSLGSGEVPTVTGTAARCRGSLMSAIDALDAAIGYVRNNEGHEYVSSELRLAASVIGEVTGVVYTDDILDRVFSRFCIGK